MEKILVVEDDRDTNEAISEYLCSLGYNVRSAYDGKEALQIFFNVAVDLVVLDIMLPEINGISVLAKIREKSDIPILMLTAVCDEYMQIMSFDGDADDYMTKPFGIMELLSRVKALLRRSAGAQTKRLEVGNLVLDDERHLVMVKGENCELTFKEYELLKLLMANCGMVLTREVIMERVWGTDFEGESRTLDMHIKTLRQKLGEEGSMIRTVRNVGYLLEKD